MPRQDQALYDAMNRELTDFLAVMDRPGTDMAKRKELRNIMMKLIQMEPEARHTLHMKETFASIMRMFDIADGSSEAGAYESAQQQVKLNHAGIGARVNSLRPRDY